MTWQVLISPRKGAPFTIYVEAANAVTARELARLQHPREGVSSPIRLGPSPGRLSA